MTIKSIFLYLKNDTDVVIFIQGEIKFLEVFEFTKFCGKIAAVVLY